MDKNIIAKLTEIIDYYKDTYQVDGDTSEVLKELLDNNVEVRGDSFYCPIWSAQVEGWVLLAGTKDKADLWVLKKILKLIKSGQPVHSMLNGNSEYLLEKLKRYGVKLVEQTGDISYISFNT